MIAGAAAALNVFGGMIEERQSEQGRQEQNTKADANEEALYSLISEVSVDSFNCSENARGLVEIFPSSKIENARRRLG